METFGEPWHSFFYRILVQKFDEYLYIPNFMKRNYKILLAIVLLFCDFICISKMKLGVDSNPDKDKLLLELLTLCLKGTIIQRL
jgi:hypothetical protein